MTVRSQKTKLDCGGGGLFCLPPYKLGSQNTPYKLGLTIYFPLSKFVGGKYLKSLKFGMAQSKALNSYEYL